MKKTTTLMAVVMSLLMAGSAAYGQDTPPPDPDAKKKHHRRGRHKARKMKLKPRSGPPGAPVTIRGRGFQAGDVVRFGPHKIIPATVAPRRIVFVTPELALGRHPVVVMRGDQILAAGKFKLTAQPGANATHRAPPADPDAPAKAAPPPDPPAEAAPPPDPDAPADEAAKSERRRKRWHRARSRPMVLKFKPRRGKPGQFVIRGRNFSPEMKVAVNKQVVEGAKVTANRIVFQMPEVQGRAVILLRAPKLRRPLFVGVHEATQPAPDPAAEKQRDEAIRKEAREQWKKRRATLAKTRTARLAQYNKRWVELRAQRATRRAQRLTKLQTQWDTALLNNDQVRAELALHAERSARLRQMLGLAEVDGQANLVVRIRLAIGQEDARHKQRMETLKKALTASAGEDVK
jgi:hypothetical protein